MSIQIHQKDEDGVDGYVSLLDSTNAMPHSYIKGQIVIAK